VKATAALPGFGRVGHSYSGGRDGPGASGEFDSRSAVA